MGEPAAAAPTPAPGSANPPPAPAADSKAKPAGAIAAAAEIRKLKVKLADREVELPEADVLEIASQKASTFIEAQKAQRAHEEHIAKLKTNWQEVLKEHGIDAKDALLKQIAQELEAQADEETLSPEARELKALKAQVAKREAADKQTKAEQEEAAHKVKVEQTKARLRATVDETIKQGNLSNSNFTRSLVLDKLRFNAEHGLPIHPSVLAAEVRESMADSFKEWLQGLDVEHVWAATEKHPEFRKAFVKKFAELKGAKSIPKPAPKAEAPAPKKYSALAEVKRLNEAHKRGIG